MIRRVTFSDLLARHGFTKATLAGKTLISVDTFERACRGKMPLAAFVSVIADALPEPRDVVEASIRAGAPRKAKAVGRAS